MDTGTGDHEKMDQEILSEIVDLAEHLMGKNLPEGPVGEGSDPMGLGVEKAEVKVGGVDKGELEQALQAKGLEQVEGSPEEEAAESPEEETSEDDDLDESELRRRGRIY